SRGGAHRPLEVPREPEHHAAHSRGVREREQHAHQRAAGAGEHHAGEQQARLPPPRASAYTVPTAARAPATAADCTRSAAAPAIMARSAPTAAPPETPST